MKACRLLLVAVVAAIVTVLGGCGGTGGPESAGGPGGLAITVLFPPDSAPAQAPKTIPAGTNSVVVRVLNPDTDDELVPDTVIPRPQSTNEARRTIEHVRAGPARVQALAKPQADGTGPTLAQAAMQVEVLPGRTAQVGLTLFGVAVTVQLLPATVDLLTSKTVRLEATAYDAIGNAIVGAQFDWSFSNTAVATISNHGLLTALTPGSGSAVATETREGVSDSRDVTVTLREPTRVTVRPRSAFLTRNETAQFTATAYDRDGDEIVGEPLTWVSSAPGVATVSSAGLVTAATEGEAAVTASTANGETGDAYVDVHLYLVKLDWEGDANLDLHVFGPDYMHGSPYHRNLPVGVLITNPTPDGAREVFSGRASVPGAYYLAVNYHQGQGPVNVQVTVEDLGAQPIVRTYTLTQASRNTGYPVRQSTASWYRPVDIFISPTSICTCGPDTTVPLYDTAPDL